MMLSLFF